MVRGREKWVDQKQPEVNSSKSESEEEFGLYSIHQVNVRSPPVTIAMEVNGKSIDMEVNMGAAVSIMSEKMKNQYFPSLSLLESDMILQTYTSDNLKVLGKISAIAKYQDQKEQVKMFGSIISHWIG